LPIYDLTGLPVGEVYQVFSSEGYIGFLVLSFREEKQGLLSGFVDVKWPLDQAVGELALLDLDDPLLEPDFHLSLDEDRLVLRVNLGNRELQLGSPICDTSEIRHPVPARRQNKRLLRR
jgi:hypothetical protein